MKQFRTAITSIIWSRATCTIRTATTATITALSPSPDLDHVQRPQDLGGAQPLRSPSWLDAASRETKDCFSAPRDG
jgi:hypothetical protein